MQRFLSPNALRTLLPILSLAVLLGAIFYLQPRTMSYFGLNLLLNLAVPIALATIAQMFILCVNDLDLSLGAFISLTACITATWLFDTPLLGVLALLACIAAYGVMGALIHLRNLPSIVVTLGMSFVWTGIAVLILPTPGVGTCVDQNVDDAETRLCPFPDHRLGGDRTCGTYRPDALGRRGCVARGWWQSEIC